MKGSLCIEPFPGVNGFYLKSPFKSLASGREIERGGAGRAGGGGGQGGQGGGGREGRERGGRGGAREGESVSDIRKSESEGDWRGY